MNKNQKMVFDLEGMISGITENKAEGLSYEEIAELRKKVADFNSMLLLVQGSAPRDNLKDPATFRFLSNYDAKKNHVQQEQVIEKLIRIYGTTLSIAMTKPSELTFILDQPRNKIDPQVRGDLGRLAGFRARLKPGEIEM